MLISRRFAVAFGASLAVAALVALPALSATSGLHWNETAKDGKTPVLTFTVTSLVIGKTTWSAHVSFANVSTKAIKVGNEFGLGFWESPTSEDLSELSALAPATKFSPARPAVLKPGASWSGVISGTGQLAASRPQLHARVVFGPLTGVAGQTAPVYWITDHSKTLAPAGTGSAVPTGPGLVA